MQKTTWTILGVLVAAMMLLVACSEGGDDDSETSGGAAFALTAPQDGASPDQESSEDSSGPETLRLQAGSDARAPAPGATGIDEGGGNDLVPVALQQVGAGRVIIYTSNMVVVVEDVSLATQQAQTAIAGLGGLVFGQSTTTEPFARTVLTFKVQPEDFQEALSRLADLGKLDSQQISTDDVTERVVDLESRIITAEASVERLRAFLATATDLEGVAQLEAQLLQRETSLELLRGQLRTVQEQAALATIFVTLIEPAPDAPEARVELVQTAYLDHDEGARCPGDDELTLDEDESMTVCITVENTGNLALTELEVRDAGLDLDEKDFVVLEGSLDGPLEPGDRLVGYFDATAELDRFASPRFTAVVIDEDGDPIRMPVGVEIEPVALDVNEDTSVPSFTEGLSGSFGALLVLGQAAVLAAAVAIPFLWVPLILVGLIWVGRRMSPRRTATTATSAVATTEGEAGD